MITVLGIFIHCLFSLPCEQPANAVASDESLTMSIKGSSQDVIVIRFPFLLRREFVEAFLGPPDICIREAEGNALLRENLYERCYYCRLKCDLLYRSSSTSLMSIIVYQNR
jgi:hypothetical protein